MATIKDSELIELVYTSSLMLMVEAGNWEWNEPIGDNTPGQLEKEAYRMATQMGLRPIAEFKSLEQVQLHWERQLRTERQKEMVRMAILLVRQHALVSVLQSHPEIKERPDVCCKIEELKRSLTGMFRQFGLRESIEKLPVTPLPGSPDTWMTWSGDALLASIEKELGGSTGPR